MRERGTLTKQSHTLMSTNDDPFLPVIKFENLRLGNYVYADSPI